MKSGNFKFLEPSGPLQVCDGTAFTKTIYTINVHKNMTLTSPWITRMYNQKAYSCIPNCQQVLDEEINENSRFLIGIPIRIKHINSGVSLNLSTKLPYLIFLQTEVPYNSECHSVCTKVKSKAKVLKQKPHNVAN